MKNKGFTLTELIASVVILGIIVLIAIPTVNSVMKDSKEELYSSQINGIEDGLRNWAVDHSLELPKTDNQSIVLTLGQLKLGGYVDAKLENPKTSKCFGNDTLLMITRYKNNYKYEVVENSGSEVTKCESVSPAVFLTGNTTMFVKKGATFTDPGLENASGQQVASTQTTITGSGESVDTSTAGNYYRITYLYTSGSDTMLLVRNVFIVE